MRSSGWSADVVGLARALGGRRVSLVGHDWGGVVAWFAAMWHPERVERLVILNAPHPAAYLRELRRSFDQPLRSWYTAFFQLPWLPEALALAGDCALLRHTLRRDPARPGGVQRCESSPSTSAPGRGRGR